MVRFSQSKGGTTMIRLLTAFAAVFFAQQSFAQVDCRYSCAPECIRLADTINYNCGGGQTPPISTTVQIYGSDTCDSELIANIGSGTNCASLHGLHRTWGVKIQGRCIDIQDVDSDVACQMFKGGANPNAVGLYNSDDCASDSDLIALVDTQTQCPQLAALTTKRIYGISAHGQCTDISDTDFNSACERFKSALIRKKK